MYNVTNVVFFQVVLFFHFLQLGQCSKKLSAIHSKSQEVKREKLIDNSDIVMENSTTCLKDSNTVNEEISMLRKTTDQKSCEMNLNEINARRMPLFYSIQNNSYLMPTVDSNLIPEGRKKRKYKQKYIKTTDLNSVQSKGKANI